MAKRQIELTFTGSGEPRRSTGWRSRLLSRQLPVKSDEEENNLETEWKFRFEIEDGAKLAESKVTGV